MTWANVLGPVVRLATVAGLGVDAGIHADLASSQPPGGYISQTDLFWFESAIATLAALLVLLTAARLAYVFALLITATALGAVVLYRYVDVGPFGPLPDMYEPFWYASKTATAIAEGIAMTAAVIGTVFPVHGPASRCGRPRPDQASSAPC